jgi:hypothetical protein
LDIHVYWNILTMHGPINVKSPNNTSKWQMGFNSAFKGLNPWHVMPNISYVVMWAYFRLYCLSKAVNFWSGVRSQHSGRREPLRSDPGGL